MSHPRPAVTLVWALLSGLLLAAGGTRAQVPVPRFAAATTTVSVYATVRDGGRLVTGLARDAFQVLEDGVPVDITVFDNAPQPITAMALIDMSASMWPRLGLMRRTAEAFASTFRPDDRVRVGGFSSTQIGISARWTRDADELRRVLHTELWPGAFSPVWNALSAAMGAMRGEPGRRVILALTDGKNNASVPGFGGGLTDVRAQVSSDGFMVYVIGPPGATLGTDIQRLTEESGGGHFELAEGADVAAVAREVAAELHQQYLLGFEPRSRDDKPHTIVVRTTDRRLTVRARSYFVSGGVR